MARIIGQVESLKSLKAELYKRNITRFSSVGDINKFCKEFPKEKQIVLESHENSLIEEIKQKSERIRDNGNRLELVRSNEIGRLDASIENYKKSKENLEKKRSSAFFSCPGDFVL